MFVEILAADTLDFVVWGLKITIWNQYDIHRLTSLNIVDCLSFFVQQKGGDIYGEVGNDPGRVFLHGLFLYHTQHG